MRQTVLGGSAAMLRGAVTGAVLVVGALAVNGRTAAAQTWSGVLNGAQQVPANATPASGFSTIALAGNILTVNVSWAGLIGGPVTGGHIHCCTAPGTNTDIAVPFLGIASTTTGTYNNSFDITNASIYTGAYITASGGTVALAQARLISGLNAGQAYVNLHNAVYPGGEIRANVTTTPEPTTFALATVGLGAAGLVARRRRQG